jgi:hypothetical protein
LPASEIIIDNKDAIAPNVFKTIQGTWNTNSAGTGKYPLADSTANYRYCTSVTGTATARAEWSCASSQAGSYQVYAWWPVFTYSMAQNVPYEITHAGGVTTVRVNQGINGGKWNSLGAYTFTADVNDEIALHAASSWPFTPELRLYHSNGTLINSASGMSGCDLVQTISESGNYVVLARDQEGDNTGTYTLSLKATKPILLTLNKTLTGSSHRTNGIIIT